MAIIYSYPLNTPKRDDLLIGTITYDEDAVNPVHGNPTVSFTVGSLLDLIASQGAAQNLQQVTNIGNTTTNSIVISNSLKVAGEYYDSSNQPGTAGQLLSSTATGTQWVNVAAQGVTSVGLSMPAAFTVANSPITQSGILTVTGAGTAAQYINGLGNLASFTAYVLPVATTVALGGIKIGYTEAGKNYPLKLDNERAYVNVPWTDTIYTLPLAADGTRGGVQIGYAENAKNYPVELDNEKMFVNVPWSDTVQTITGTGTDNTDSGILLSDSGGTVLILGDGSVTAAQTGNTITLTGTDTGVTGVTLATADSTGAPLVESIANRELTLTSAKYIGGANVGYVPEGGTGTTYLKGDGTWAAIPTGLQFKGTWDASGGGGGTPDLTQAANKGDGFLWICDVAGTAYPNGGTNEPSTWNLGDWAVYDGTAWTRVPATNSGVTSLTTTDGTFIDLTPDAATTGAVTVTADLSAADGNNTGTSQRFLTKNNTWAVPAYTTDTNTTYTIDVPSATTSINLKGSDGTDDAIVLTGGTNVTLSRTDASTIDIAATNTTYTAGIGLTLNAEEFDVNVNSTAGNAPESLSTDANRTYAVQLDNNSSNLVVNVPWADTSYDWEIKDNQATPSTGDVINGKTVQFVGATGALSTVLTDPNSDGNFVMTLTSPDTQPVLYTLAGAAASGVGVTDYDLVLSADGTAQDTMVFKQGSNVTFTRQSNSLTITAANDNDQYALAGAASTAAGEYNLVLSNDGADQDTMVFKQGSNVTFTRADDLLTIQSKWDANTKTVAGYVAAPGDVANKVWKTDANGNPAWRVDDTGDEITYSIASGNTKIITLTGSDGSTSTVALADGSDISVAGNNGTITITNDSPDTGIPAVISDGAATPNLSFASNVTAAMVRTQIGAGTGDGVVESLTTTGSSGAATLTNAGVLNIPTPPTYTLDADQSSQGNDSNPNITLDASAGTDDSVQLFGGNLITVTRDGSSKIDIASTAAPNTVFVGPSGAGSAQGGTAGLVPAPSHTTYNGEYFLKQDATWAIPPGQGIISESVAVANATVNNTPLTATINSATRTLALSSKKYMGGNLVGYVPNGGTNSTYLRGDGSWASIGSQFQGTWSADANFGITPFGTPSLEIPSIGPNPFSNGDFYICNVAGTATPNGSGTTPNSWAIGDTVIWDDANSEWVKVPATTSGVNSVDTTDGTYINLTPNSASTGSITVTADLSAQDGTSDTNTRFLSKDNTWDVPSYTTNTNTTYDLLAVQTGGTNVNPALRLDPSSGSNDDVTLTAGNCISITRVSDTEIEFVNTCPDTGLPAIIVDDAQGNMSFGNTNVTAATIRTKIGAGTMSNFTVSADTNTATTTISNGDTLKILGGTNCETVSNPDGTITINSTDTQGVSKIVAGTNVTISPTGGTGNVTINSLDTQENTTWYVRDSNDDDKTVNNLKYLKFVTATGALDTDLTGAGTTSNPYVMTLTSPDTNTQENTTWTVRDSNNDDKTVNNLKYLKFVTATGALDTALTGAGTTGDPYLMTLTSPDTNTNTTYTAGNGINFSGNPATQINADINYISTSGSNNYLKLGADDRGTTVPTQGEIVYLGTGNDEITSRAYVSDLPFTNNTGTVTGTGTSGVVSKWNTAGTGLIDSGLSFPPSTTYASFVLGASGTTTVQFIGNASQTGDFSIKNTTGAIILQPNNSSTANRVASFSTTDIRLNESTIVSGSYLQIVDNTSTPFGDFYVGSKITPSDSLNGFRINSISSGTYIDVRNTGDQIIYRDYTNASGAINSRFKMDMSAGTFTASGNIIAYGSPSDKRLKENIKPIKSALDKVSKLQGVTFNWKKSDSILNIKEDVGFIAQDVQKVIPELVREDKDGMLSMRHQGITPILLEAIKELKAEIEELKKQIK